MWLVSLAPRNETERKINLDILISMDIKWRRHIKNNVFFLGAALTGVRVYGTTYKQTNKHNEILS